MAAVEYHIQDLRCWYYQHVVSHHVSTNQDKDAEKDVDVAAWQSDIAFETWRCERLEEPTFKIVQREPLPTLGSLGSEKQRRRDKETCDFCRISEGTSTVCFSALAAEACLKEYIWIADKLPGWMKAAPHTLAFT